MADNRTIFLAVHTDSGEVLNTSTDRDAAMSAGMAVMEDEGMTRENAFASVSIVELSGAAPGVRAFLREYVDRDFR